MRIQTYSRGVVLWIDDRFANNFSTPDPDDVWGEVFGKFSDRVFRLMDLSLEIACSYEEAIDAITNAKEARAAGAYVLTILDLNIPERVGSTPRMKYGIEVAKELQEVGMPFIFLSANSNATSTLDEENLGTVRYYEKNPADGIWQLPEKLARSILSEFRWNISWISQLNEIVAALEPESDIVKTCKRSPEVFRHFPIFRPFHDYVEHCEYRGQTDLPHCFVVRSELDHCDAFVQQSLMLLLHDQIMLNPGKIRIRYGQAHEYDYTVELRNPDYMREHDFISVLRIWPDEVTPENLEDLITDANHRAGTTIFIVATDESADRYVECLRQHHIPTIEELPGSHWSDPGEREELIKRTCTLMFQQWNRRSKSGHKFRLPLGYIEHPELLINPIHWVALLEAKSVARELSDPYEIVDELHKALDEIDVEHYEVIGNCLANDQPVPFEQLLKVGHDTILRSAADDLPAWTEKALDVWLNASWHFPFGLGKEFAQLQYAETDHESWRPRNWEAWEDHCFDALFGMLDQFRKYNPRRTQTTARQHDLNRVGRFLNKLGGRRFLEDTDAADWEALESLRWPHHRYPLPAAVNRRLKAAKRYLWIQPDGLDIAPSLPTGRLRYRFLSEIVSSYSNVLDWGHEIAPHLPKGWRESVSHLLKLINEHEIVERWTDSEERRKIWSALKGLSRNATPVAYITARTILARPLCKSGEDKDPAAFLQSVQGSGVILYAIKQAWKERLTQYLVLTQETEGYEEAYATDLRRSLAFLQVARNVVESNGDSKGQPRLHSLGDSVAELLDVLANCEGSQFGEAIANFLARPDEQMFQWWHRKDDAFRKAMESVSDDPDVREAAILGSLYRTKSDHLWATLDVASLLSQITFTHRYYDGYHFLSTLNDLRVCYKESIPDVGPAVISTVFELFLMSLEGLVAQLEFCLRTAGAVERADALIPPGVRVVTDSGYAPPDPEQFAKLFRVSDADDEFAVGVLGIPGSGTKHQHRFHDWESDTNVRI